MNTHTHIYLIIILIELMNKTVEKTETKSDETEAHTQEPILFETKLHNLFSELSVGVYVEVEDCLVNVNFDNTR